MDQVLTFHYTDMHNKFKFIFRIHVSLDCIARASLSYIVKVCLCIYKPRNSSESVATELQAAHIKLPGATRFGFKMSAS